MHAPILVLLHTLVVPTDPDDITVALGLTEDAVWHCAGETNAHGRTIFGNLPSEEIYTSPAASASKPWSAIVRLQKR